MSEIQTDALKRLLDVIGGDAEDLQEFIDDFSEVAPSLAHQISRGVASGDWQAVKIAAHSLKSNSHDLGVTTLAALCAEIEKESAEGTVENVDLKMQQLSQEVTGAVKALNTLDLSSVA